MLKKKVFVLVVRCKEDAPKMSKAKAQPPICVLELEEDTAFYYLYSIQDQGTLISN